MRCMSNNIVYHGFMACGFLLFTAGGFGAVIAIVVDDAWVDVSIAPIIAGTILMIHSIFEV